MVTLSECNGAIEPLLRAHTQVTRVLYSAGFDLLARHNKEGRE